MQVSVEQTGGLERRMTVEVPAERVENEVDSRLKSLAGRVRLDGFRPGKVPMKVVKKRYGGQVRDEVVQEVMQSSFYEALAQQQLQPVGGPHLEPRTNEPGKALEFEAVFEVYPEVEVGGLDRLEVERPSVEITEADIDQVLERMRGQHTEYQPVEREARDQDQVTISYEAEIDGQPLPGSQGENAAIVLGAGRHLEELEKGLVGAHAGEERRVPVSFPADHPREELAGKTAEFKVQLHEVAEPQPPALDDDFARLFGVEEGGLEALRREVRASMQRELDQAIHETVKRQLLDQLLEANPMDVPRALIDQEIERRRSEQGPGDGESGEVEEREARRRVALGLILGEVIKQQGIQADPDKVRQKIETIAADYENPDEVVRWYYDNNQLRQNVEAIVVEDQVVDWLLSQSHVQDKPMAFEEAIQARRSA